MRPIVCTLMSTYNGEEFLHEQIDSILSQEDVQVRLIVRDDGSSDKTLSILEKYQTQNQLRYSQGENIGPARSFIKLLQEAPKTDFYAFSDQDDFWLSNKLRTATEFIGESALPALYYCQTQIVDKRLSLQPSVKINPIGTFGEALIYQFIGGCTMVFNDALRNIILKYIPQYLPMHDVWIYDIAMAINANIYFDSVPHILYRQHNHNVIGQGYSQWKEWKKRIRRVILNREHLRYKVGVELMKGYYQMMPPENQNLIQTFIEAKHNFKKRISLMADKRFKCSDEQTYQKFVLSILLNTY